MSNMWFIADPHFHHPNIIKYCERPFDTEKQMRSEIMGALKKRVRSDDTLFVLGDIAMVSKSMTTLLTDDIMKIPGNKILIIGNHDQLSVQSYIDMGFSQVHTNYEVTYHIDAQRSIEFILVHDPAWAQIPDKNYIHGHIHRLWKYKRIPEMNINLINVGVDVWDFKPVSMEQIYQLMRTNKCHIDEK